jgi:hypothetical protein
MLHEVWCEGAVLNEVTAAGGRQSYGSITEAPESDMH